MAAAVERGPAGWRISPVVKGISIDSRGVRPGEVFIAIPGASHDGHQFVQQAIALGAVAVIGERPGLQLPVPYVEVSSSRIAAAELADLFYGHPSHAVDCIAVTGTNGKTSVVYWLTHVMRQANLTTGMISSVVNDTGSRLHPARLTTPESPELQQLLAEMRDAHVTHAVVEVSSHGIVQHRIRDVRFEAAILTNITREHLDFHGTMERYVNAKSRLFEELPAEGLGILNADDEYYDVVRQRITASQISYGIDAGEVRAQVLDDEPWSTKIRIMHPSFDGEVTIPHPGRYNVYNVLAVATTAFWLGISPDTILHAIGTLPAVPGRMHVMQRDTSPMVIVDYAHTPDGLLQVLKAVRKLGRDQVWLVFGARGGRDRGKRPEMGSIAAKWADHVVLTTDSPYNEDPLEIAGQLAEGIRLVAPEVLYQVELDRRQAIHVAIQSAKASDIVIITGRGPESTQYLGDRSVRLVDAEVVQEYLGLNAAKQEGSHAGGIG